jgi:hypothetical protein
MQIKLQKKLQKLALMNEMAKDLSCSDLAEGDFLN